MAEKVIEVITHRDDADLIRDFAKSQELACWSLLDSADEQQISISILVPADKRQMVEDNLYNLLALREDAFATVSSVDAIIQGAPEATGKEENKDKKKSKQRATLTRDEMYQQASIATKVDANFILLVILSTLVAAIGLLEDNVTVVIGAMVIAPLLGPNLWLALGTTLGDSALIKESLIAGLTGLSIAFLVSLAIGLVWHPDLASQELMSRTQFGFDSIVLALASGAAAVLSITSGVSSVLVGVMVAVALLPPTATSGIMLGAGEYTQSWNAAMLLLLNVVCVNLSAKLVFISKGIQPRTWFEQQAARKTRFLRMGIWIFSLLLLAMLIAERMWGDL